jgi:hypothetical protein
MVTIPWLLVLATDTFERLKYTLEISITMLDINSDYREIFYTFHCFPKKTLKNLCTILFWVIKFHNFVRILSYFIVFYYLSCQLLRIFIFVLYFSFMLLYFIYNFDSIFKVFKILENIHLSLNIFRDIVHFILILPTM